MARLVCNSIIAAQAAAEKAEELVSVLQAVSKLYAQREKERAERIKKLVERKATTAGLAVAAAVLICSTGAVAASSAIDAEKLPEPAVDEAQPYPLDEPTRQFLLELSRKPWTPEKYVAASPAPARTSANSLTVGAGRLWSTSYHSIQAVSVRNESASTYDVVWVECGFFRRGELIAAEKGHVRNLAAGATGFTSLYASQPGADTTECRVSSVEGARS